MKCASGFAVGMLLVGLVSGAFGATGGVAATARLPADAASSPRLDVVFCVDTTGSMGDEIDVVKEQMRQMVADIVAGEPKPDVRFGLVIYRDRGDEYVTKTHELIGDVEEVTARINAIVANGGRDYPESMNEALHVAVQDMNWDLATGTGRLLLLIADAPPHMDYENDYDYRKECEEALARGIVIDTIGCSGLQDADQAIFEEIASLTLGEFDLLTYAREYVTKEGDRKLVMWSGGTAYALSGDVSADEWREGADVLAGRGRATKIASARHDADAITAGVAMGGGMATESRPSGYGGAGGYGGYATGEVAAEVAFGSADLAAGMRLVRGGKAGAPGPAGPAGPSAAARAVAPGRSYNNLDRLLTRQAQVQLARQGVRFAGLPYLPRGDWRGGTSAQATRQALVVRSQDEWERVWPFVAEPEGTEAPPVVDFDRDMVIVAFAGDKWRGRSVRIEDVWEDTDGLHIRVKRGRDDRDAESPYHIIVVSRYDGNVIWK